VNIPPYIEPVPKFTRPSAPIINSIVSGNQELIVNFTPGLSGGTPILSYEYSTNNGLSWLAISTTISPIVIPGLTNGTTYEVIIRAVNAVGSGESSNMVTGTPVTVPSAPTITSITPGNQQLTVNFTAGATGGSPITNYQYSTNNGSSFTSAGTTSSPIVITGLTNGTSYQVVIRAVNAVGLGASSNMVTGTPVTTPSAPTITSIAPGDQQLTVNFTAGATGGSPITNYEYSTNNGSSFTSASITSSPIVITGLTNGTSYQVIIRAINAFGSGASSNMVTGTPTTPAYPPGTQLLENPEFTDIVSNGANGWSSSQGWDAYSATLANSPTAVTNMPIYTGVYPTSSSTGFVIFSYVSATVSQTVSISNLIGINIITVLLNIANVSNRDLTDTFTLQVQYKNSTGTVLYTTSTGSISAPSTWTDYTLTLPRDGSPNFDLIKSITVNITGIDTGFWNGQFGPAMDYCRLTVS
jgi:hypothetical protein